MRRRNVLALIAGGLSLAALARWQFARLFTEEAPYDVESTSGPLEIRRYHPRVVAETTVKDRPWDGALNEGFQRLAGYIFGKNETRRRVAMTAPVNARSDGGSWTITFTMPAGHGLRTLPQPEDARVMLRDAGPFRAAVLRYRGRYDADRIAAAFEELRTLAREAGLTTRGEPQFAGYDPPWTLPMLRRNEVWIELGG